MCIIVINCEVRMIDPIFVRLCNNTINIRWAIMLIFKYINTIIINDRHNITSIIRCKIHSSSTKSISTLICFHPSHVFSSQHLTKDLFNFHTIMHKFAIAFTLTLNCWLCSHWATHIVTDIIYIIIILVYLRSDTFG